MQGNLRRKTSDTNDDLFRTSILFPFFFLCIALFPCFEQANCLDVDFLSYIQQTKEDDLSVSIRLDEINDYMYVLGTTWGSVAQQNKGQSDIILSQYPLSNQTEWNWIIQYGGSGIDVALALEVDSDGYIYVAGCVTPESKKYCSMYIAQINAYQQGAILWTYSNASSTSYSYITSLALTDNERQLFAIGTTDANSLPTNTTTGDFFILRIDTYQGTVLSFYQFGGSGVDIATSIAITEIAYAGFLAGFTTSQLTFLPSYDPQQTYFYAVKFNYSEFSVLPSASIQFPVPFDDNFYKPIIVSDNTSFYFTTSFRGNLTQYGLSSSSNSIDVMIAKITSFGNLVWGTSLGDPNSDEFPTDMRVSGGNLYISGYRKKYVGSIYTTDSFLYKVNTNGKATNIKYLNQMDTIATSLSYHSSEKIVYFLGQGVATLNGKINIGGSDIFYGICGDDNMTDTSGGGILSSTTITTSSSSSTGILSTSSIQYISDSNAQAREKIYIGVGVGGGIFLALIASVLLFALFLTKRRRKQRGVEDGTPDELTDIIIKETIGHGHFGVVYRGLWFGTDVALKQIVNSKNDFEEIQNEAKVLKKLSHTHIVKYFGTFKTENEMFLVMEFVPMGSLDKFVYKEKDNLSSTDLIRMSKQIASGMVYLASRKIIHTDLGLRNILVTTDPKSKYSVKIADFGLSHEIKQQKMRNDEELTELPGSTSEMENIFPVKWSPPEVISSGTYSTHSDVWSFGVVLWELFSYGARPFHGLNNIEVAKIVLKGERLRSPKNCPPEIFELMTNCWIVFSKERPSFDQILIQLENILDLYSVTELNNSEGFLSSPSLIKDHRRIEPTMTNMTNASNPYVSSHPDVGSSFSETATDDNYTYSREAEYYLTPSKQLASPKLLKTKIRAVKSEVARETKIKHVTSDIVRSTNV